MNQPPRPPPLPRKPKAPVKKHGRGLTPKQQEAQKRMRAAKLCTTSLYAAIAGYVFMLIPFMLPGAHVAAAVVGLACGFLGLARLARVGMGPRLSDLAKVSPIERVSAKVARRARPQAFTGLGLSGCLLVFVAGAFLLASNAQESRAGDRRQIFRTPVERRAAEELRLVAEREKMAGVWLHDQIQRHTKTPEFTPQDAYTEDDIARRLMRFLEAFPGTRASRDIRMSEDEPYVTFRRILEEHGWDG